MFVLDFSIEIGTAQASSPASDSVYARHLLVVAVIVTASAASDWQRDDHYCWLMHSAADSAYKIAVLLTAAHCPNEIIVTAGVLLAIGDAERFVF